MYDGEHEPICRTCDKQGTFSEVIVDYTQAYYCSKECREADDPFCVRCGDLGNTFLNKLTYFNIIQDFICKNCQIWYINEYFKIIDNFKLVPYNENIPDNATLLDEYHKNIGW